MFGRIRSPPKDLPVRMFLCALVASMALAFVFCANQARPFLIIAVAFGILFWRAAGVAQQSADIVRSDLRLRQLAESAPGMAIITDPAGRCTYANAALRRFTGLDAELLLGNGWTAALHPEEAARFAAAWRRAMRAQKPWDSQCRIRRDDGASIVHAVRGLPITDEAGLITEWLLACTDIQELADAKAALARSKEEWQAIVAARTAEVAQLQKIDTIGQLTAGVAHDFNNLLQPIMGSFELLQRRLPRADTRNQRMIETGLQSTLRAATLVQRLLAVARRQDLQPRIVDVGRLVLDFEDLVRRSLGEGVELSVEVEPGLPATLVDPNQLELAILNLAVNARDAMPGGGAVTISVSLRDAGDASASPDAVPALAPGAYVRIRVADTGTGMDAPTLARAAEPFFTTKGIRGTGLGLSLVHGLAAQSGGALRLASAPNQGTVAEIWLPASTETAATKLVSHAGIPPLSMSSTVLLVDDEELVRGGTTDMLADIGYAVIPAASGVEAVRYLSDLTLAIDILVTDYRMQGINGADLAAEAARLRPGMPVLLVTGYGVVSDGRASGLPRLVKPFRQAEMAVRIAELLEQDGADTPPTSLFSL